MKNSQKVLPMHDCISVNLRSIHNIVILKNKQIKIFHNDYIHGQSTCSRLSTKACNRSPT